MREDYAFISWKTVRENLRTGFVYDRDAWVTDHWAHPYQGSIFFNAARSNGYTFWQSAPFTLAGSLLWECCLENKPPAKNDLVDTTFGGITRGEITHRVAGLIRMESEARPPSFWRELLAGLIDPVEGFDRIFGRKPPREDSGESDAPGGAVLSAQIGYRNVRGAPGSSRGFLSFEIEGGDPFSGEIRRPFDFFQATVEAGAPGGAAISRTEERGVLAAWDLSDRAGAARHVAGVFMDFEYWNNEAEVAAGQTFGLGLLSRFPVGRNLQLVTDSNLIAFPLAGLETREPTDGDERPYDYGWGGGVRLMGRLERSRRIVARLSYGASWTRTLDGLSDASSLQFLRGEGRLPISDRMEAGIGYSWFRRRTSFPGGAERSRTQPEWRFFASWTLQ